MNSKIINHGEEISHTESVVSCPSERVSCPPFQCLSLPVYHPELRYLLSLSTNSILIFALLYLPFTFLCKLMFSHTHTLVPINVCFLEIVPLQESFVASLALSPAELDGAYVYLWPSPHFFPI